MQKVNVNVYICKGVNILLSVFIAAVVVIVYIAIIFVVVVVVVVAAVEVKTFL